VARNLAADQSPGQLVTGPRPARDHPS